MEDKYYLMFETKEKLPGYPDFFDSGISNIKQSLEEDRIASCVEDTVELTTYTPKISFDFQVVSSNYFVSDILWEVICDYISWELIFKKILMFNKNKKNVATKGYIVFSFLNQYDKKRNYIDSLESLYVVPNFKQKRQAELLQPSINYEILRKFDVLPSLYDGYTNSLVVSEKFMKDSRLENTKLEFLPLEKAGKILLHREDRIKRLYKIKTDSELESLTPIKGKVLLNEGFKEKNILTNTDIKGN